jgi:hypothetical protein
MPVRASASGSTTHTGTAIFSSWEFARQNDGAKMVAEPWATSAAGRAGLEVCYGQRRA